MERLNPRVDFAFKKLFGKEENKDILIPFINAVVSKEDRVKDIILINPYNYKDYPSDKLSILDIKATDERGQQYNIEMQLTDEVYYNQRALYYWSKLYTSQLSEGQGYEDLKKTISINVLNFNYFSEEKDYHNVFHLLNVKSHKRYFEDLELHFIELEKFDKDLEHLKTALDRWANFLKRAQKYSVEDLPEQMQVEPGIKKAMSVLDTMRLSKDEQEVYEARLKWLRDEASAIKKAAMKAHAEGEAEGVERTARNMLRKGMDVDTISEVTGLSIQAIEAIKKLVS